MTSTPEFDFLCDLLNSKSNRSDKYLMNYGEGSDDGPFYWNTGEESEFYYWYGGGIFSRSSYIAIEWHKASTNYGAGWGIAGAATEDTGTYSFICEWGNKISTTEIKAQIGDYIKWYNGQEKEPEIKIYCEGILLKQEEDYTYEYQNNVEVGKGEVVITGKGRYTGKKTVTFDIIPREVLNLSAEATAQRGLKLTWDLRDDCDGYEIQYSTTSVFDEYDEDFVEGMENTEYVTESLERGTIYYVRVRAYKNVGNEKVNGLWETIDKKTGNQILVDEMWGFNNLKIQVGPSWFYRMLEPAEAEEIYLHTGGKFGYSYPVYAKLDGICYGMVMAAISMMDYETPDGMFGINSLNSIKSFQELEAYQSGELNMSAQDEVIFAHLVQGLTKLHPYWENNKNKLENFYNAVKNCQEGNENVCVIKITNDGKACHEMLAIGIEEENDEYIKIAVYDPTYASNESRFLYLLKEDGVITSWSYNTGENTYWAGRIDDLNGKYLAYSTLEAEQVAKVLREDINTGNLGFVKCLVRLHGRESLIDTIKAWKEEQDFEKTYGKAFEFSAGDSTSETEEFSEVYWIDSNINHTFTDVPAGVTFSVSSGYHAASVEVAEVSDVTIKVGDTSANQITVTSDNAAAFTVIFKDFTTLSEPVKETTITGTSGAGTTATIQQTADQKIQISGATSMQYEREAGVRDTNTGVMQNPATSETPTVELEVSKSYQIEEGEEAPQLAASSNNDGVFDQVIEITKECSHVYETIIEKAATCSATGMKYEKCTLCGEKKSGSETTIPKKAHTYGSWTTVSTATVSQKEKQQRICSACKTKETREYGSVLKPTITVNASTILLRTKQSTTGLKVTGLAAGDSIVSMTLNSSTYVKISNVNLKAGTCKLTALKKKETKGTTKLIIKLKSGLTKEIPIKVQTSAVKTSSIGNVKKTLTMKVKGTVKLSPVLNPFTSQDKIKYSSSNKKSVKVSAKGVLTALKPGTAKITVKAGKKSFSCKVTVEGIKNTGLKNVPSTLTLKVKKTKTLKPVRVPSNSTDTITYKSSNTKVATVSAKGVIKAKKKGTAKITVKCGSATVTCTVTVN